jgi:hypothetical protein
MNDIHRERLSQVQLNAVRRSHGCILVYTASALMKALMTAQFKRLCWRVITAAGPNDIPAAIGSIRADAPLLTVVVDAFTDEHPREILDMLRATGVKCPLMLLTRMRGDQGRGFQLKPRWIEKQQQQQTGAGEADTQGAADHSTPTGSARTVLTQAEGYAMGYDVVYDTPFDYSTALEITDLFLTVSGRSREAVVASSNFVRIRTTLSEVTDRFFTKPGPEHYERLGQEMAKAHAAELRSLKHVGETPKNAGTGGPISAAAAGGDPSLEEQQRVPTPEVIDTHPAFVILQGRYEHAQQVLFTTQKELAHRNFQLSEAETRIERLEAEKQELSDANHELRRGLEQASGNSMLAAERLEVMQRKAYDTARIKSLESIVRSLRVKQEEQERLAADREKKLAETQADLDDVSDRYKKERASLESMLTNMAAARSDEERDTQAESHKRDSELARRRLEVDALRELCLSLRRRVEASENNALAACDVDVHILNNASAIVMDYYNGGYHKSRPWAGDAAALRPSYQRAPVAPRNLESRLTNAAKDSTNTTPNAGPLGGRHGSFASESNMSMLDQFNPRRNSSQPQPTNQSSNSLQNSILSAPQRKSSPVATRDAGTSPIREMIERTTAAALDAIIAKAKSLNQPPTPTSTSATAAAAPAVGKTSARQASTASLGSGRTSRADDGDDQDVQPPSGGSKQPRLRRRRSSTIVSLEPTLVIEDDSGHHRRVAPDDNDPISPLRDWSPDLAQREPDDDVAASVLISEDSAAALGGDQASRNPSMRRKPSQTRRRQPANTTDAAGKRRSPLATRDIDSPVVNTPDESPTRPLSRHLSAMDVKPPRRATFANKPPDLEEGGSNPLTRGGGSSGTLSPQDSNVSTGALATHRISRLAGAGAVATAATKLKSKVNPNARHVTRGQAERDQHRVDSSTRRPAEEALPPTSVLETEHAAKDADSIVKFEFDRLQDIARQHILNQMDAFAVVLKQLRDVVLLRVRPFTRPYLHALQTRQTQLTDALDSIIATLPGDMEGLQQRADAYFAVYCERRSVKQMVDEVQKATSALGQKERETLQRRLNGARKRHDDMATVLVSQGDFAGYSEIRAEIMDLEAQLSRWMMPDERAEQLIGTLSPITGRNRSSTPHTQTLNRFVESAESDGSIDERIVQHLREILVESKYQPADELLATVRKSAVAVAAMLAHHTKTLAATADAVSVDRAVSMMREDGGATEAALLAMSTESDAAARAKDEGLSGLAVMEATRQARLRTEATMPIPLLLKIGKARAVEAVVRMGDTTKKFVKEARSNEEKTRQELAQKGMDLRLFNAEVDLGFLKRLSSPNGYYDVTPGTLQELFEAHHKQLKRLMRHLKDRSPLTNIKLVDAALLERQYRVEIGKDGEAKAHQQPLNVPFALAADTAIIARFADYYQEETEGQYRVSKSKFKRTCDTLQRDEEAQTDAIRFLLSPDGSDSRPVSAGGYGGLPTYSPMSTGGREAGGGGGAKGLTPYAIVFGHQAHGHAVGGPHGRVLPHVVSTFGTKHAAPAAVELPKAVILPGRQLALGAKVAVVRVDTSAAAKIVSDSKTVAAREATTMSRNAMRSRASPRAGTGGGAEGGTENEDLTASVDGGAQSARVLSATNATPHPPHEPLTSRVATAAEVSQRQLAPDERARRRQLLKGLHLPKLK